MNSTILTTIQYALAQGDISPAELIELAKAHTVHAKADSTPAKTEDRTTRLYKELRLEGLTNGLQSGATLIGIVVATIGIGGLLSTLWSTLDTSGRIITLALFQFGLVFLATINREESQRTVRAAFYILSGILAPISLSLLATETIGEFDVAWLAVFVSGTTTALFSWLVYRTQRPLAKIFAAVYGGSLIISLYLALAQTLSISLDGRLDFVLGSVAIGYVLLATKGERHIGPLAAAPLSLLGTIGTLVFLLSRGYSNEMKSAWQLITPFAIYALMRAGIEKRLPLTFLSTVIGSAVYVAIISAAYLGGFPFVWPIALVAVGFIIIGLSSYWKKETRHA